MQLTGGNLTQHVSELIRHTIYYNYSLSHLRLRRTNYLLKKYEPKNKRPHQTIRHSIQTEKGKYPKRNITSTSEEQTLKTTSEEQG